jgi:hypothetical protein
MQRGGPRGSQLAPHRSLIRVVSGPDNTSPWACRPIDVRPTARIWFFRSGCSLSGLGHEDPFPRANLSDRCRFSQGTFAGMCGNRPDAPIPVARGTEVERQGSTQSGRSCRPTASDALAPFADLCPGPQIYESRRVSSHSIEERRSYRPALVEQWISALAALAVSANAELPQA